MKPTEEFTKREWLICFDVGYGENYEVVEAVSAEQAKQIAYEFAQQEFESQASWDCIGEATDELKEEYL